MAPTSPQEVHRLYVEVACEKDDCDRNVDDQVVESVENCSIQPSTCNTWCPFHSGIQELNEFHGVLNLVPTLEDKSYR